MNLKQSDADAMDRIYVRRSELEKLVIEIITKQVEKECDALGEAVVHLEELLEKLPKDIN